MPKAKRARKPQDSVLQVRIELLEVEPTVWRRVLVPARITLEELHLVLQEVMGWTNSHLHGFVLGDRKFGDMRDPDSKGLGIEDERKFRLEELLGPGEAMRYDYDFGDGWEHEVTVESALPFDDRYAYPVCVAGQRACPPEDCGGPVGYDGLLAILADEGHEEHDELRRWLGGHFDPEGFDVNRTNAALHGRR